MDSWSVISCAGAKHYAGEAKGSQRVVMATVAVRRPCALFEIPITSRYAARAAAVHGVGAALSLVSGPAAIYVVARTRSSLIVSLTFPPLDRSVRLLLLKFDRWEIMGPLSDAATPVTATGRGASWYPGLVYLFVRSLVRSLGFPGFTDLHRSKAPSETPANLHMDAVDPRPTHLFPINSACHLHSLFVCLTHSSFYGDMSSTSRANSNSIPEGNALSEGRSASTTLPLFPKTTMIMLFEIILIWHHRPLSSQCMLSTSGLGSTCGTSALMALD